MSEKQYKSPLVSCICCREVKSAKGIFSHFITAHTEEGKARVAKSLSMGRHTMSKQPKTLSMAEQQYLAMPKKCNQCDGVIAYEKRRNDFCSMHCSASHSNKIRQISGWKMSEESSKKISESNKKKHTSCRLTLTVCVSCNSNFFNRVGWKQRKSCGKPDCISSKTRTCTKCGKVETTTGTFTSKLCVFCNDSLTYRNRCKFTFNLGDYPLEFDLNLLNEHKMFHPKNNPRGLSRDHMVSIKYGKTHKIDPSIISHPANCKLMFQSENTRKHDSNSITLEALLVRIAEWDKKY